MQSFQTLQQQQLQQHLQHQVDMIVGYSIVIRSIRLTKH